LRAVATALLIGTTIAASEEAAKKIKIGVVYDYSGPMAAGGSDLHALGTKIMIDYFNKKGGVEGYQIEPIYADA
jgi:ABC-type branched-subunit amino acid transport system substrate-binding protein